MTEAYRLRLLRGLEEELVASGYRLVAGVDEAGRGCLAGPVVAAAVLLEPGCLVPGVDDSKKLEVEQRTLLARRIEEAAVASRVVAIDAETIDRVNVLEATRRAMERALRELEPVPDCALVDAVPLRGLSFPTLPLVRGDSLSHAVACASILAKTERDRMMTEYAKSYPEYGFERNKGYGSPEHLRTLIELGPSPIHRLTFRSVLPRVDDPVAREAS